MFLLSSRVIAGVVGVGVLLFACGGEDRRAGFDDSAPDGAAPIGPRLPTDQADGGGATVGCSADLRSTIDSSGNPVECPPDQGCANGKCMPACDAAAESKGPLGCRYRVATPALY